MSKKKESEAPKNPAGSGGSGKVFIRYEISADICNKGVGFNIKDAVGTFMSTHGHAYRMTEFKSVSDSMTAVIEFVDNGKYDFNMTALLEHIYKSGRLPTRANKQPKIHLRPLPCSEHIEIVQPVRDDVGWQKTVQDLHQKLGEREGVIQNLTDSLSQRQRELGDSIRKNLELEQRVQGLAERPIRFATPELSVLKSYLPGSLESLFFASDDWENLGENRNAFVEFSGRTFLEYVEDKYGLTLKNDDELIEWYDKISVATNWNETPNAKEYQEKKRKIEANKSVLKIAEEGKADETMIAGIRVVVEADKVKEQELEAQVAASKGVFERDRGVCESVKSDERKYDELESFMSNANKRMESGAEFPILISMGSGNAPYLRAFVPSDNRNSELERHIHTKLIDALSISGDYGVEMRVNGDETLAFNVVPKGEVDTKKMKKDFGRFFRYLKRNEAKLREDNVLGSLGIGLRVVTLYD